MYRRRAIIVGLAGVLSACAGPPPAPTGEPAASPTSVPPTAAGTWPPTPPTPTTAAATATAAPTAVPTATPLPDVALDVRLWNGTAEVQLDGRTVEPGQIMVEPGVHHLAALIDGDVV